MADFPSNSSATGSADPVLTTTLSTCPQRSQPMPVKLPESTSHPRPRPLSIDTKQGFSLSLQQHDGRTNSKRAAMPEHYTLTPIALRRCEGSGLFKGRKRVRGGEGKAGRATAAVSQCRDTGGWSSLEDPRCRIQQGRDSKDEACFEEGRAGTRLAGTVHQR